MEVRTHKCMCTTVWMCMSEDSCRSQFSLSTIGVIRHGHKRLYLLSTLTVLFAFDLRHSLNIVGQGDLPSVGIIGTCHHIHHYYYYCSTWEKPGSGIHQASVLPFSYIPSPINYFWWHQYPEENIFNCLLIVQKNKPPMILGTCN